MLSVFIAVDFKGLLLILGEIDKYWILIVHWNWGSKRR